MSAARAREPTKVWRANGGRVFLYRDNAFTLIPVVNGVQLVYSPSDGKAAFVGWRSGTVVGSPVVPPDPPAQIPPTKKEDARVVLRRYPTGFSSSWGHIVSLGAA